MYAERAKVVAPHLIRDSKRIDMCRCKCLDNEPDNRKLRRTYNTVFDSELVSSASSATDI